ncbi:hypothetical protein OGAPHI_001690 [Ogataea philodendri]|uniref:Sphingoid long-chain base transporter RSB1 n=1 Tax=Ogataea philodendri TaxID=1378263 RepID=A0A9P8T6L2_9ASCO|nr:uncharacterized protein OGAPHI_001690 [Ogataea philodendri]KAH3667936.1 hypothetical protein OGAPHI_001690 [Ogataea philodendri]
MDAGKDSTLLLAHKIAGKQIVASELICDGIDYFKRISAEVPELVKREGHEYLKGKKPSVAGNAVFLGLMSFFLLFHLIYGFYNKHRWFAVSWTIGLALEFVGYLGRILLHGQMSSFNYYVMQMVGLTIAPCFLMAGIYYLLAQVTTVVSPRLSLLRPNQYTFVFIGCDVLAILLQSAGGGLSSSNAGNSYQTGKSILIAGLIVQVVSMFFFQLCWYSFIFRWRREHNRHGDAHFVPEYAAVRQRNIFTIFPYLVSIAVLLIFIRSIYRIAELFDGFDSNLATNETIFFIFESAMMTGACLILTIDHPATAYGGLVKIDHSMKAVFSMANQEADLLRKEESEIRIL